MAMIPEYANRIRMLAKVKGVLNEWESHPFNGSSCGFIETMELAVEKDWSLSKKRMEIIDKMVEKYLPEDAEKLSLKEDDFPGEESCAAHESRELRFGERVVARQNDDGWVVFIDNALAGIPVSLAQVRTIGDWLTSSVEHIEMAFKSRSFMSAAVGLNKDDAF